MSVFAKADERDWIIINASSSYAKVWFNVSTGEIGNILNGTAKIEKVGDFYKCSVTGKFLTGGNFTMYIQNSIADGIETYDGVVGSGAIFYGVQLEKLPFASSYIPTEASEVTRSGDFCEVDYSGNITERNDNTTWIADFDKLGDISTQHQFIASIKNVLNTNIVASLNGNNNLHSNFTSSGSITTSNFASGRVAVSIDEATHSLYVNGTLDTSIAVDRDALHSPQGLRIGVRDIGEELFGHLKNFRIYDRALTPTEIGMA